MKGTKAFEIIVNRLEAMVAQCERNKEVARIVAEYEDRLRRVENAQAVQKVSPS